MMQPRIIGRIRRADGAVDRCELKIVPEGKPAVEGASGNPGRVAVVPVRQPAEPPAIPRRSRTRFQ